MCDFTRFGGRVLNDGLAESRLAQGVEAEEAQAYRRQAI